MPQQLEASFGHKPYLRCFSRNFVNGRGAKRIFPLSGHVLGNTVKRWPQFPSDSSVGKVSSHYSSNRVLNDVHHFLGKNEVWVLGSEVQMDFSGPRGPCLFGRMMAHSELAKMWLLTSPLLKRLVLDSRFQLSALRSRGSGGMEIMEPAITRRTNEQWNKGGIQIV